MKEICCEHVVKLLAGCPNLEVMELKSVKAFGRLEINSLKLKKLYLEDLCMDDAGTDFSLEIFAPNLQHFEISGVLEDGKFRLLDVSSLINAYLNFSNSCFCENDCEDEHQGFMTLVVHNFQKLSCVTELTLGSWFTEGSIENRLSTAYVVVVWTAYTSSSQTPFCGNTPGRVKDFESFIDYVLAHSVASKIEKLRLSGEFRCESNINGWLSFAVERNVEHVVLRSYDERILFGEPFCTCSSLKTLDITYAEFPYRKTTSWTNLKSIKMDEISLDNEAIASLLAGCPELETMELSGLHCFSCLEINSLKLKRVYLKDLCLDKDLAESEFFVEIFAPYRKHFRISGNLEDFELRLLDVSSLVDASLTFRHRCANWTCCDSGDDEEESRWNYHQIFIITLVQENLQKLSCVTELTLGAWFTKALCMMQLKGVSIPELKCKCLTLELDDYFNLFGATGILRALHHVETLNIDIFNPFGRSWCDFELECSAEGDNIDLQSCISSFELPNLKNVKIVQSSALCLRCDSATRRTFNKGFDTRFELLELVLKNATILEKLVMPPAMIKCRICSNFFVSEFVSRMPKIVLGCHLPMSLLEWYDYSRFLD
ncbi:hypothetical protein BC332_31540 [Capsicum chinense]|nr:hypothetical protein BC332_31540 [Capsicum chinense]